MKEKALLFVDVDDGPCPIYYYREPHFIAARKMGFACLTVASKHHASTDRLNKYSDAVFFVDEINVKNLIDLFNDLSHQYEIQIIFCFAGHASFHYGQVGCIVAEVCKTVGLRYASAESINACNNKFIMRDLLSSNNVRSIKYALCNDIHSLRTEAEKIGYPVMAKPPMGAGSSFTKKCKTWEELLAFYHVFQKLCFETNMISFYGKENKCVTQNGEIHHYIPGISILLEEYIVGVEGCLECVIDDEQCYPLIISEKLILVERDNTVLENLLITPAQSFSDSQINSIKQYATECIYALGIKNTILHFEYRITNNGPVVIEINPRLGGLYVNAAFKDLAEIDPYQLYLLILLGCSEAKNIIHSACEKIKIASSHYSMMVIYPEISGYFCGFDGLDYLNHIPGIVDYSVLPSGQYVNAEAEENYLFKCWVKVNNNAHAISLYNEIAHHVKPIIQKIGLQTPNGTRF